MNLTDYLTGTYNSGTGNESSSTDVDSGFNWSSVPVPNLAAYQIATTGHFRCDAPTPRYDLVTLNNAPAIGFAYSLLLQFFGALSVPTTITGSILIELFNTNDYTLCSGANRIFRSQLDLSLTQTGSTPLTNSNYSYSESISTDVIGGTTILPANAVNYLDNGETAELDGTTGSVPTLSGTWSKTFQSAGYIMDLPDVFIVKVTYTQPPINPGPVGFTCGFVLNTEQVNPNYQRRPPILSLRSEHPYFASLIDHTGAVASAVKEGSNVQTYHFQDGVSSREARASVSGYRKPVIEQDYRGRIFLGTTKNSDNSTPTFVSNDNGATYTVLASGVSGMNFSNRLGNGMVVVGLIPGFSPPLVLGTVLDFTRYKAPDSSATEGGSGQYIVTNLTRIYESYYIWQAYWLGSGDVFISNGYDVIYHWSGDCPLTNTTIPMPGWVYWTPTIWDRNDYKSPHISGTVEGGMVSCAIKKNTNPVEVYTKYSPDFGVTWGAEVLAGNLGAIDNTLTGPRACHIWQQAAKSCIPGQRPLRDNALVLTNGYNFMMQSPDSGATWAVMP